MTAPAPVDLTRSERYLVARALREYAERVSESAAFLRQPFDDEPDQLRYDQAAAEMELSAAWARDLAGRVLP